MEAFRHNEALLAALDTSTPIRALALTSPTSGNSRLLF
jgi:hypothetical protein